MSSVGALTPTYIPPHLRGKVEDFREEPDGYVSFAHPEAALGLGPEESRKFVSPEQYKLTFDRSHRLKNFNEALRGQYALRRPQTGFQSLNQGIASALRKAFDWGTSNQGRAVGTAAVLSALAGGGLGAWMGARQGSGPIRKALLFALLGGGIGAGMTALSQAKHNRREAWLSKQAERAEMGFPEGEIIRAVRNDVSLTPQEKADALRVVVQLDSSDRMQLSRLLRTTIGASAGVLIVRFLRSRGLLPSLVGGILGALAANVTRPRMDYNRLGQVSITNYL